ncbi:zinc finger protein Helios-like isoform X2 [Lethenteron reissneri]|uniref:zinc finger protein Helios-like isoform X2 n=2 Tax=Lethenteron reissneri TaxID=7753 RepID=UPI002AB634A7|nr:zinc finger protein Helios-like isoform X2 [Lethenteron reissneri]
MGSQRCVDMIMEVDNESAAGNQPHTEGWTDGDRAGAASSPSPSSPPGGSDHMIQANTIKVEAPSDDEELEPGAGVAALGSRHGGDARWSGAREAAGGEHGALDGIGGGGGETPGSGKLACDICGLVCVGPNVLLVHKRSHTGERPFQCVQCGASFTQKGNLLRHVKLHSGEKPFKCHMCNYACRRRDALAGHLKTHAIGKPHKCAYCGRSYKQRSSLEEHKERCHAYLQHAALNGPHAAPPDAESRPAQEGRGRGAESVQEPEHGGAAPADRTPASNLGKRKSFTPQKFIVEKHWRSSGGPDVRIPAPQPFPKEQELVPPLIMSYLGASGLAGDLSHGPYAGMVCQPYGLPLPLPPRSNTPINRGGAVDGHGGIAEGLCFQTKSSSRAAAAAAAAAASAAAVDASSPDNGENNNNSGGAFNNNNNSGQESTDEDGSLAGDRNGVQEMKDEEEGAKQQRRPQRRRDRDVFRVFRPDGTAVRSYRCTHCEVLFLDHVMYTIHMGCHGYREPLECNVCGHLSRDRYEFSSHIVRGEHSRSLD